jgi:hypothetical protein
MNSIALLQDDLRRRFVAPTRSVTFYLHLFFAVVIGGGFEIWYQVVFHGIIQNEWSCEAISSALFGYFPAIVAVALIDFVHEPQPYLRSFGLAAAGVFLVILFLALGTSSLFRLSWALAGGLLAVLFWWAASGEKNCFKDINPGAPTPDPNGRLSGDHKNWQI